MSFKPSHGPKGHQKPKPFRHTGHPGKKQVQKPGRINHYHRFTAHPGHKPKKTKAGMLNMCAFEAAGLITGGDALAAFMDYGAPADGATIPEALLYMGVTPVEAVTLTSGTCLSLHRPGWDHAVVVDELGEHGMWAWSWGELYHLTWEYVSAYGEDAWQM